MCRITSLACSIVLAGLIWGQPSAAAEKKPATRDALQAEIASIKVPHVAWRAIAWKSCLLEGLQEARARKKPALLWVFIDRPVDDARC